MTVCACGCGQPTAIASKTDARRGARKGQPNRFLNTHNNRLAIVRRECTVCGGPTAYGTDSRCLDCENKARNAEGLAIFWSHVERSNGPAACWPWTGYVAPNGYGNTSRGRGRHDWTHRIAYEATFGPVPDGMVLDHTCHTADLSCAGGPSCRHRRCCNPAHLEAVTHLVNVRRGRGVTKAVAA